MFDNTYAVIALKLSDFGLVEDLGAPQDADSELQRAAVSAGASRLSWLNAGGADVAACALPAAATAPKASR
jgi:hypothetical protein